MGSRSPKTPSSTSPTLILTHPTSAERARISLLTHAVWGGALRPEDYVRREEFLTTVPLARDGGITHWILTEDGAPPDTRPVFSSCESIRKAALAASPSGAEVRLVTGTAHGIASVFTEPQYRGRGYASRMMAEVGARLRAWQTSSSPSSPSSLFSVLYSDVGPAFYARAGWPPMAATHLSFPPSASSGPEGLAKPVSSHDLAPLCETDERLLSTAVQTLARATGRPAVALVPGLDAMLWHLYREDFMTEHVLGRKPSVRGAVVDRHGPGKRIWAVFARSYYGGLERKEGNTLYVLRFVVEDLEGTNDDDLVDAVGAIIELAQKEADAWNVQDVQMWNPAPELRRAVEKTGIKFDSIERDKESIPSLMWYGEGSSADVDWVANEKYGWC